MQTIQDRIKFIRGNESRRGFAAKLNVTEGTIRNYENGTSLPNAEFLENAYKILRIEPKWLLMGEGATYADESPYQGTPPGELLVRINELEGLLAQRDEELSSLKNETLAAYRILVKNMRIGVPLLSEEELLLELKEKCVQNK